MNLVSFLALCYFMFIVTGCTKDDHSPTPMVEYTFPEESAQHEATLLQWPHQYQYGTAFRNDLDPTWVAITRTLVSSEKVIVVAYDATEKKRIQELLVANGVSMANVEFVIAKTDDFWARDNGPIYVKDNQGNIVIQDWGFNGWGYKADFEKDDALPTAIAHHQSRPVVNLNTVMINEGGSVELDGQGTLMACRSSILNRNRNRGMSQQEAENIFTQYLGATHFIWLEGQAGLDITDQHIDGFARFGNAHTIVTLSQADLLEFDVLQPDIDMLYAAKNAQGVPYNFLTLPLTQNNVSTTKGKNLGFKGSYCNYYIANTVVLVPTYNDPMDATALEQLQTLYPERTVVGIDCRNVYEYGGMLHCVTQQQPAQ